MMPRETIKLSGKVSSFLCKEKIRCWIYDFITIEFVLCREAVGPAHGLLRADNKQGSVCAV